MADGFQLPGIQQSLLQAQALRGQPSSQGPLMPSTQPPMQPYIRPQYQGPSPEEQALLQRAIQSQAQAQAQQMFNSARSGQRGILGLVRSGYDALSGSAKKEKERYFTQALGSLEAQDKLRQAEAVREFSNETAQTAARIGYDEFTRLRGEAREDRADLRDRERTVLDRENERLREDQVRRAEQSFERQLMYEEFAQQQAMTEDEREYGRNQLTEERLYEDIAANDETFNLLLSRYNELRDAQPVLASMAGVELEGTKQNMWNGFWRTVAGTGGLTGYLPSVLDDSQRVDTLANSETLRRLGTLETPLTPVSDADIRLVMNTGISPYKNEDVNYEQLEKEMAAIKKEIDARAKLAAEQDSRYTRAQFNLDSSIRRIPPPGSR